MYARPTAAGGGGAAYYAGYASPSSSDSMMGGDPRRRYPGAGGGVAAVGGGGGGMIGSGSAPGSGEGSRFAPSPFQYNGRVATALVPCVLVLLGAGGGVVVATLVVGLMVSYVLDALQMRKGAFAAVWISFFTTAAALAFSGVAFGPRIPLPLSLLLLLSSMNLVFLCGVWVSLQFRWLQLEHPSVVLALERLLFACCPLTAAAIQTWGLVASVGIVYAPFYLTPILFGLFWLFSLPRQSSFRARRGSEHRVSALAAGGGSSGSLSSAASKDTEILGRLECAVHCFVVLFLPVTFHVAVHHSRFMESVHELCDTLLLLFVPVLFMLFASTRGALSWAITDPRKLQLIRILNGGFALFVVIGCIEIRVVLTSFAHYIHFPPPLNYLLVTLALYGLGFGAAAHLLGLLRGTVGSVVVMAVLLVSAVAGALVVGMPWKMLPAPAITAVYLAHFYSSGSISAYFIFAAGTALSTAWFLMHNFYFLVAAVGPVSIKTLCQWLVVSVVLCLGVPGLVLLPRSQPLVGSLLVAQALLVCRVEDILYNSDHVDENIYPSYLVVLTTVAGYVACRRLQAEGRAGPWATWLATCLYFAKLAMLFVSTPTVVLSSSVLLLAITPTFLLYKGERGRGGVGGGRMQPWQAYAHVVAICLAVWYCRFTLFDAIVTFTGHRPGHSLLVGLLALFCIVASLPVVFFHFPHVQAARRAAALALLSAVAFVVLRPPLPSAWRLFWDAQHYPEDDDDPDDDIIYGQHMDGPAWPAWLLLWTLVAALTAFSSAFPTGQAEPLRLAFAVGIGVSSGIYVCAKFFAMVPTLVQVLLVAASVLAAAFLLFTHHPTPWSPKLMPAVFGVEVLLLPATYLAVGLGKTIQISVNGEDDGSQFMMSDYEAETMREGARNSIVGLFCAVFLLMALATKLKIALLQREKAAGAGIGAGSTPGGSLGGPSGTMMGNGDGALPDHSPFMPSHRSIQHRKGNFLAAFSSKKSWMPAVGNAATLLAFLLATLLISTFGDGGDRAIFFIAPILLLLNHDPTVLGMSFGDRQRYFPLSLAISGYLVAYCLYAIFYNTILGYYYIGWSMHTENLQTLLYLGKSFVLMLLCVPMHVSFNRFMWDYVKQSDYLLLLLAPLNLPAVIVSDTATVRILGGVGLAYGLVQYLMSRQIRLAGMRYI